MTRILHVINGLSSGGAEAMLTRLLLLRQPGLQQSAVTLLRGGSNAQKLRQNGVPVHDLDLRFGPLAILQLAGIIRREKPDVVQSWMYYADLAALAALQLSGRRAETRLIWGIRCSDMRLDLYRPWLRGAVRLAAKLSGRPDIVSVNSAAGQQVHAALGYHPKRWALVHNGIELDRFKPDAAARAQIRAELGIDDATPLIACLARNDAMKDYPTFIRMLDLLPGVKAFAAGIGTQSLPDHPRLFRLGRRDDVPALLAAADLLVSSSAFGEGFSNAIGEAMASGLPVVATDVGDAKLIIGETGRIVPPGNAEALAEAARSLLALPPERMTALRQAARDRIETEFSLPRAAQSFRRLYA